MGYRVVALVHRASVNQNYSSCFDWVIGLANSMLRKWKHLEEIAFIREQDIRNQEQKTPDIRLQ